MTYWTSHASSPARCDLTFVRSTSERLWTAPSRPSDPPPPRKTFGCKACWIRERDPSLAIPRGSNRSCGISSPTRSNSRPRAGACRCTCNASIRTSRSSSATRDKAFLPRCCRSSSIDSGKRIAPVQGGTFIVRLPLTITDIADSTSRVHPTAEVERTIALDGPRLDGLRVLVVDDDPDALNLVIAILTSAGAVARTALSAAEALRVFEQWHPDVLVSDIEMPGED